MQARASHPFRRWLHAQRTRDDAIGDLARDMARDRCLKARGLAGIRRHLEGVHGACSGAVAALECAHQEWSALTAGDAV
jgi:hypothetical protein